MGIGYCLVNQTRREVIRFHRLPVSTKREIAGNPVSAAITAWYLLEHAGDEIAFVADTGGRWPFKTGSPTDLALYKEMTEEAIESLVVSEILRDEGRQLYSDDEPETYCRILRNVWMER